MRTIVGYKRIYPDNSRKRSGYIYIHIYVCFFVCFIYLFMFAIAVQHGKLHIRLLSDSNPSLIKMVPTCTKPHCKCTKPCVFGHRRAIVGYNRIIFGCESDLFLSVCSMLVQHGTQKIRLISDSYPTPIRQLSNSYQSGSMMYKTYCKCTKLQSFRLRTQHGKGPHFTHELANQILPAEKCEAVTLSARQIRVNPKRNQHTASQHHASSLQ